MKKIRVRRLSAAVVTAAAATVALTAPFATADTSANGMTVVGNNYATGTAYTVNVITGVPGVTATVYDTLGSDTITVGTATSPSDSSQASVQWTPAKSGIHHLWVILSGSTQSLPTPGPVDVVVTDAPVVSPGSASSLLPSIFSGLSSQAAG